MKKTLFYFLMLCIPLQLFSQEAYVKLSQAKTQKVTYVFNTNIIGNENILQGLGSSEEEIKEKVEEVRVLLEKGTRESNKYYNLTEQGILLVDLNESLICKTQVEFNTFFGLEKDQNIYVDGYLLENKKYKIALVSILEIEIVEPTTENKLKNKALNIWTLTKEERYASSSK